MGLLDLMKGSYDLIKIFIVIVLIDLIYLYLIKSKFKEMVKSIQIIPLKMNYIGAIIAYLFLSIGLHKFIIEPKKDLNEAFLLGIVIYGVFEGTSMAIFQNWDIKILLVDIFWGGTLFYLSAMVYRYYNKKDRIK